MTTSLAHIPSDWSTTEPDLEEILSASPIVLYTLELEAGRAQATWVSGNLPRLVGESVADALEKPDWWATRIHPADRPTALARQIELIERGRLVHQYRFRHRDGHYIWIRDELKLVVNNGAGYRAIGSWTDVTEQAAAERSLRETQARFADFANIASDYF